jgi:SM-20-related protein
MEDKFEEAIQQMMANGHGIIDNWLDVEALKALGISLNKRYDSAMFKKAEIGQHTEQQLAAAVRGDQIFWLTNNGSEKAEVSFLTHASSFMNYLNRTCYTGLTSNEFHYAVYEAGTNYHKHRDQFKSDRSRKFSMVLYLNEAWKTEDGGELVIYADQTAKIAPLFGRLVFFQSHLEHEVLRSNFQRKSITGWLKG